VKEEDWALVPERTQVKERHLAVALADLLAMDLLAIHLACFPVSNLCPLRSDYPPPLPPVAVQPLQPAAVQCATGSSAAQGRAELVRSPALKHVGG